MLRLDSIIYNIFKLNRGSNLYPGENRITSIKYMEIPVDSDVFEVPLFAFHKFCNMLDKGINASTIVATLYSCGAESSYKSIEAIMRNVLYTTFDCHLSKILIDDTSNIYYATMGAVFDKDLNPLMVMSWQMERQNDEREPYSFKRPILHITPMSFVRKEDPVQRFLVGKMLTTALDMDIPEPYLFTNRLHFKTNESSFKIKVEIDDCPFNIKGVDVPSISVTNENLLQLAAEHIDEIEI
jgi:hypothetical protein